MKKALFLLLVLPFMFSSCTKDDDQDQDQNQNKDITVSEKQEAFVMLTTATWCSYCGTWGIPTFDGAFEGNENINAKLVNGSALHYSSSDPMYLPMALTMKDHFQIGGPPNLWIEFDNSYNLQPEGWKTAVKSRQSETNPDCGIGFKVNRSGKDFTVKVRVKFFNSMSGTYNLAVYVNESGIIENQSGSTPDHNHKHVLRGEITANDPWGVEMFSGNSPADFNDTYTFTADGSMNASKLDFVAVVYEMDGGVPVASVNSNTWFH